MIIRILVNWGERFNLPRGSAKSASPLIQSNKGTTRSRPWDKERGGVGILKLPGFYKKKKDKNLITEKRGSSEEDVRKRIIQKKKKKKSIC